MRKIKRPSLCVVSILFALAAAIAPSVTAVAATAVVTLAADGRTGERRFQPDLIRILPGDKIVFESAADGQVLASIPGMLPGGAKPILGRLGHALRVTFAQDGVYGLQDTPGYQAGTVALVVVGKPINELAAKSAAMPPPAKARFAKIFAVLDGW